MSFISGDICVIGKSLPIEQEYTLVSSWQELQSIWSQKTSVLLVIDWDFIYSEINELLEILKHNNSSPFPIIYVDEVSVPTVLARLTSFSFSAIITKNETPKLQRHVLMALEKVRLKKQEQELLQLMESQNKDLESLSKDLEESKDEQQKDIAVAKHKVEMATLKLEAIQRVIVALYTADSIGEMESLLLEALRQAVDLQQVKIVLSNTPWTESFSSDVHVLKFPIKMEDQNLGSCFFVSQSGWQKADENWLQQITEMIAVAVDRWLSLERGLGMKENWEASFRSIQSKVAVVDENYNLLAHNQNTTEAREKCHKVLFHLDQPCFGCKLGKAFQVTHLDRKDNDLHIFEVKSLKDFDEVEEEVYINVYEDVTAHVRQGRERVEAAKLAELGIIGSSIAHELNNPLSGVMSYIQILLTEVDENSELHGILDQMEEGAKRCKQIIQNLLSFTRFSKAEEETEFYLHEIIEKALLFLETKFRTLGLKIEVDIKSNVIIKGSENLFLQALLEILKNSTEEFSDLLSLTPNYRSKLLIRQSQNSNSVIIDVIDNGRGIPVDKLEKVFTPLFTLKNPSHNRGLGLTTAYQIIQAMKGRIEIFTVQPTGVQVRIVLPAKTITS
ncbi:MAG: HAMP domain-containing histidine kinase [Bdellovibrionales bacterium]|nr:HAMP domain-containing histidine kinase [Bdellovibrionales bacterium]